MKKNQFTGTAKEPHRNRKLFQFNNDQYCSPWSVAARSGNVLLIIYGNYAVLAEESVLKCEKGKRNYLAELHVCVLPINFNVMICCVIRDKVQSDLKPSGCSSVKCLAREINCRLLNFTSASILKLLMMSLKVSENVVWVSTSLDPGETPSTPDPSCLHMGL